MSLQNRLLTEVVLPLMRGRRVRTATHARRVVAARAVRPGPSTPPRRLDRHATVTVRHHDGWPVYDLAPRSQQPQRHVLYLHGGAYINEIVIWHWRFLGHLVQHAPAAAIVPIYPLGAALGAEQTVAAATDVADELIQRHGSEQVVLMGDSAGAGMALAVAQALRDAGLSTHHIVLISPWLDIATNRPEQQTLAAHDPMLDIPVLVAAGHAYAAGLPAEDPRVSPIHGDMHGLPPITAFTSTRDLLTPDSHRLREACTQAGVPCVLLDTPAAPHVYPLLPTPEGRAARKRILELLRR